MCVNISFELYVARCYQNKFRNALVRGIDFQLSIDHVREMLSERKCYYCKNLLTSPPRSCKGGVSQEYVTKPTDRTIERLFNEEGYLPENCVAACFACNNAKSAFESSPIKMETFNIEEFTKRRRHNA